MTVRYYPVPAGRSHILSSLLITTRLAAFNFLVVIHCVSGTHVTSSVALIRGLGKRLRDTGKQTYYVHVSIFLLTSGAGQADLESIAFWGDQRERPPHQRKAADVARILGPGGYTRA